MNNNQPLLYGIIGLLGGVIITGAVMSFSGSWTRTGGMMSGTSDHMSMSMSEMSSELKNKSGDDFDKTFISEMIDHHQGAIDMAQEAKKSAKHDEIKTLANDIIAAQEKEIAQMKAWQKEWGY